MTNTGTATPAATVLAYVLTVLGITQADMVDIAPGMFTDREHAAAYITAWGTVAVWATSPTSITATVADTHAGRVHGEAILTVVLDATAVFDDVFATGNITQTSPISAVIDW